MDEKRSNHRKLIQKLLAYGAKPDIQDKQGRTALHHATINRCVVAVEALLQQGKANPNLVDTEQKTPLLHAISRQQEYQTDDYIIVRASLKSGANPNVRDKDGNTPLHFAGDSGNYEMAQMLIVNGANPKLKNRKGEMPKHLSPPQTPVYGHLVDQHGNTYYLEPPSLPVYP